MTRKDWERAYPQVPQAFHNRLEKTIQGIQNSDQNIGFETKEVVNMKRKPKKTLVFLVAAVLLIGTTAFAATIPGIREFIGLSGYSPLPEAQQLIKTIAPIRVEQAIPTRGDIPKEELEKRPKLPTEDSLITVTEVAFDGRNLYVAYRPSETGKSYSIDVGYLIIDGVEHGLESAANTEGGLEEKYIKADLSDLNLQGAFEMTLPLTIYKNNVRYWNQLVTFALCSDGENLRKVELPQHFVINDYNVDITEVTLSPMETTISFTYRLSGVDSKSRALMVKDAYSFTLTDENGNEYKIGTSAYNLEQTSNETWEIHVSLTTAPILFSAKQLTVTPVYHEHSPNEQETALNSKHLTAEAIVINLAP